LRAFEWQQSIFARSFQGGYLLWRASYASSHCRSALFGPLFKALAHEEYFAK